GGVEERIGHRSDGEAPQWAVAGRTDDDEMAGACCRLLDQTGGHGIGEMDRCRRVDGLRDEVVRFDHPLLSLFETELLILPFRFRSCLFRRDAPDDVDEV